MFANTVGTFSASTQLRVLHCMRSRQLYDSFHFKSKYWDSSWLKHLKGCWQELTSHAMPRLVENAKTWLKWSLTSKLYLNVCHALRKKSQSNKKGSMKSLIYSNKEHDGPKWFVAGESEAAEFIWMGRLFFPLPPSHRTKHRHLLAWTDRQGSPPSMLKLC